MHKTFCNPSSERPLLHPFYGTKQGMTPAQIQRLEKQSSLLHSKGRICGHFYNHLLGDLICTCKKLHTIVLNGIICKIHRLHQKCAININVFLSSNPFRLIKQGEFSCVACRHHLSNSGFIGCCFLVTFINLINILVINLYEINLIVCAHMY